MRLPFPYRPEGEVIHPLLEELHDLDWPAASAAGRRWVEAVRAEKPRAFAMENLLREYPLSTAEGLALMRLAEALLRVPDAETAMALTADQLSRADFSGASQSWLATLSSQALQLSKKMLGEGDGKPGLVARLGAKAVVAATVRAVQLMGRQFVLGETLKEALAEAGRQRRSVKGLRFSYDMLGEGARTEADALAYMEKYHASIAALAADRDPALPIEETDGISIKLSAIDARYEQLQHAHVMAVLVPRVAELADAAAAADINLTIDAEESERLELSLDVFEAVARHIAGRHPAWQGFGLAIQAYQTRTQDAIREVARIGRELHLRFMVRLVKGAYWDSEVKRAQELGLPGYPVYTHKHHTDISYLACAWLMLSLPDVIYPQFAGHNAGTISAVLALAQRAGVPFELQRLHGMGEAVHAQVHAENPDLGCRVYAPVGPHRDLLAYLVRRLLENGANSSFVHQLSDPALDVAELVRSPLWVDGTSGVALPADILGARHNTAGVDLACATFTAPLVAAGRTTDVDMPVDTPMAAIPDIVARLAAAQPGWNATPVNVRAQALETAADALERDLPAWAARIVKEAHRTWGDAVSEVREAADFCRYYAGQARGLMAPRELPGITGERNTYRLGGRGAWVCISPWNFPLSIFTGQIAAALAAGNTVAAKPAEQTPAVGQAMVALLHRSGIPEDVLVPVFGAGETAGAVLVAHPQVAGVAFTGSTAVARAIARTLAAKDGSIVPLIAETGGINAMIVDSTALPEQVVDAVVQSAFQSAGQRCSALRVLCVQEDIADGLLKMLGGAIELLRVGDAADLATDLGPVIDAVAAQTLQRQIDALQARGRLVARASLAPDAPANAVAPVAYEIGDIAEAREEIFGPVLQVVRWKGPVADLVARIDALGYGLTLGVHTRMDTRAQAIAAAARVGNVYVNRNIVGAVVGVQPFGGEGLSGTGPKAGGPYYLPRFCVEQCVTVNTTAAGGNVDLFMRAD